MHSPAVLLAIVALGSSTMAQEKKGKGLQLKDLPAAVQKTVQANLNGGEVKSIAKEKEDGVEQYEVETVPNGKARNFDVDSKGALLVIEEQTTIETIPAAARVSILIKAGDGKLGTTETFSKPGQPMLYEAAYTDKKGKQHEVLVKADGSDTKSKQCESPLAPGDRARGFDQGPTQKIEYHERHAAGTKCEPNGDSQD